MVEKIHVRPGPVVKDRRPRIIELLQVLTAVRITSVQYGRLTVAISPSGTVNSAVLVIPVKRLLINRNNWRTPGEQVASRIETVAFIR